MAVSMCCSARSKEKSDPKRIAPNDHKLQLRYFRDRPRLFWAEPTMPGRTCLEVVTTSPRSFRISSLSLAACKLGRLLELQLPGRLLHLLLEERDARLLLPLRIDRFPGLRLVADA